MVTSGVHEHHKCEYGFLRRCRSCGEDRCTRFIRGECRACAARRRYHAKLKLDPAWRKRRHETARRSYGRNREKITAKTSAYLKRHRAKFNAWCVEWRRANLYKARAAGAACEWKRRHPGETPPPFWGCRDCGAVFAWRGPKLDAVCRKRSCRSVHVFVVRLPHVGEGLARQVPPLG